MSLSQRFVWFFDSFCCPASLRIQGEPEYSSVCTGIFSMCLLSFFAYVFAMKSYEVFMYQSVEFKAVVQDKVDQQKIGDIMFAVRVSQESHQLVNNTYFQFYASLEGSVQGQDYYQTVKEYELGPCKKQLWEGVDEQILIGYYNLEEQWLCPTQSIQIKNTKKSTSDFRFVEILVDFCLFEDYCENITNIKSYINQFTKYNGYMMAQFLIYDKTITLKDAEPFKSTIKEVFTTFTSTSSSFVQISMASFEIQTDTSVMPWSQKTNQQGIYVHQMQSFGAVYDPDYTYLINTRISFQPKTTIAERTLGKLDDMLSYAGGLFGIITGFLAFFLQSYNEYKYELGVARASFTVGDSNRQVKPERMNFFFYIKYSMYEWIRDLCFCQPSWKDCEEVYNAKEEAVEQMNVVTLFRKIHYLEAIISSQFGASDRICLQLLRPQPLEEVQRKRRVLLYYEKVAKSSITKVLSDIYPSANELSILMPRDSSKVKQLKLKQMWSQVLKPYFECNLELDEEEKPESIELEDQDLEVQEEIKEIFVNMPQEKRALIQGKIPIMILYRLLKLHYEGKSTIQAEPYTIDALQTEKNM